MLKANMGDDWLNIHKTYEIIFLLISMIANVASAQADTKQISELLNNGYEIKTAYSTMSIDTGYMRANGSLGYNIDRIDTNIIRFIVLQKGSSAYRCESAGAKSTNEFRC